MSDPPYTVLCKEKVYLCPYLKFLTTIVCYFHISQAIYLTTVFPKPHACREEERLHTLDIRRVLAFYLDRTKPFRSPLRLFVAIAVRMKGLPVSSQIISSSISFFIHLCYDMASVTPLRRVLVHSTRSHKASAAFLAPMPILDLCRAETWSSVPIFTSHYAISQQSRHDARFRHVILQFFIQVVTDPTSRLNCL